MSSNETRLRGFLSRYLPAEIIDSEDLFASGLVSSLFALQLVMFVEKEFAITVDNEDLELANFNSLSALVRFVDRKLAPA